MENKVVEYLKTNKYKYEKNDLIAELKKAGYVDDDIMEGVREAYGEMNELVSTISSDKAPELTRKGKIAEFLKGFFIFLLINSVVISVIGFIIADYSRFATILFPVSIVMIIAILAGWVRLIKRSFRSGRRYFAMGLIVALFLPLLIAGGCFVVVMNSLSGL